MQFITSRFGKFVNTRRIGRGGQASIYLAHYNMDFSEPHPLVFKKFNKNRHYGIERNILDKLGYHKNIIQVLDNGQCVINKKQDSPILVFKYYNKGDGRDFVDNYTTKNITDSCIAVERDFAALWEAIAFAHSKGISHRDIKPENILIHKPKTNKASIVLTDWSLSSSNDVLYGIQGSTSYIPPEIIMKSNQYNYKCDIWSAGATWISLCHGTNMLEYHHGNNMKKYGYVYIKDKFPHIWDRFTPITQTILEHTLRIDPTERMEAHEIVELLQA